MASRKLPGFSVTAIRAFPHDCRTIAENAVATLLPHVDDNYRKSTLSAVVLSRPVSIPRRIHFVGLNQEKIAERQFLSPAILCLCTRSTDGYVRHAALRQLLNEREPWVIPFIILLAGEYVVDIINDIAASVSKFDREAYVRFALENRPLLRLMRSNAVSYWNRYYRNSFLKKTDYPGLRFLLEIERWAA